MRKSLVPLFVMLSIVELSCCCGSVLKFSLISCRPELCGNLLQNKATLGLQKGEVSIAQNGQIKIKIHRLTILVTNEVAANKTLEVFVGSFTQGVFRGDLIGTITTDAHGNFNGTINTSGKKPVIFQPETLVFGQVILNEPGVRSEFITGSSED